MGGRTQLLYLTSLLFAAHASPPKCTFGQTCWPAPETWATFNASIGGRLVAPVPPAAVCHNDRQLYDAAACEVAKSNWTNSFWRASQPGGYQDLLWENGSEQCFIDATQDAPCQQGLVPYLATAAQTTADIQASVKFAAAHNLLLVVKNTGHDLLGRSSGAGSFGIWTHNLRGISFNDSFTPTGCPATSASPSVTLQAGEHWIDVFRAADEHGVLVVGGAVRSVGAAGGWMLGGGHSALGTLYGMGVDNVLQLTVVTADGEYHTVNACSEPDLFWALRGGGGSAFGVLTSVTYKTHPALNNVVVGILSWNGPTDEDSNAVSAALVKLMPTITTTGWSGYFNLNPPSLVEKTDALMIHANSPFGVDITAGNYTEVNATFSSLFELERGNVEAKYLVFPSWYSFMENIILQDVIIAIRGIPSGRLLDADALTNHAEALVDLATATPAGGSFNFVAGGAVSTFDPDSVALHPYWRKALVSYGIGAIWNSTTSIEDANAIRANVTAMTKELERIVGEDAAAYTNEADPDEPRWREVFWGSHYPRLLEIKKAIDPNNVFTCNRCVGSEL
ncbi:FAD/FMN-containing protein [Auriculariales sp. MPI-PUGE-AT-0066]|nr:FAD/FMN-containing protein [Auriculariales sp. MPI-PUGE-AT-0066]